jgi:hypothetical protein
MSSAALRTHIFPIALLALYCIALNAAFVAGRMPYEDDIGRATIPQMQYYAKWLKQGIIPLWNSELGSGYYQHATGHTAMLYPPNIVFYRTLHWTTAVRASLALHTFTASVWAYLLGGALGLGTLPALLLAICVGSGGVMAAHQIHLNIVLGFSHLLAMLWIATQWLRADRSWLWALGGSVAFGFSLLGGQPQYVWLAVLTVVIYGLVAWRTRAVPLCGFWVTAGRISLVGVVGLLLSAVQLLPMYHYVTRFPRPQPAGHYDFVTAGSFQWSDFLRFVLPAPGLKSSMGMHYWEAFGFVGSGALLLATLRLLDRRTWNWRVSLGVALIGVGVLLMLGSNTPLYHLLAPIPPFSLLRIPARNVVLVALGLAILAADYLEALTHKPNSALCHRALVLAAGGSLLLAGIAAWLLGPYSGRWADLSVVALVLVATSIALTSSRQVSTAVWISIGLSAVQLALVWHALNPTVPLQFWIMPPSATQLVLNRSVYTGENVACLEPGSPTWPPGLIEQKAPADWRDRLAANACAVFEVPSALVSDAILPVTSMYIDTHLRRTAAQPQEMADLCTRLGIKWVSMPPKPLGPPWIQPDPAHPHLYENPASIGSFFLCEQTVLGPGGFPRPAPRDGPYDLQPVECNKIGPGHFLLHLNAPSPTTLFIMQGNYPGWAATVDGKPASLLPAQPGGFFMHIPIEPGEHEITLSFEPWDYDVGLALSLATLALVCLAAGYGLWLKSRH